MGENLTQTDIVVNVLFQLLNIAIFFFFFIKFAGKYISKTIEERVAKEKKLADADKEYESMIADAVMRRDTLMNEALVHKSQLVDEGKALAEQDKEKILAQAKREASLILEKAQQEAALRGQDLDAHFEQGVKSVSMTVLQKLFGSDKDMQERYLDTLVKEFSTSYKN